MEILQVEDLSTGYGNFQVLEDIDIHVSENEIVSIVGPNGAGKSTVFKVIMGYLPVWNGTIRFQDVEIGDTQTSQLVKKGIAYVPQNNNIFPKMTIDENLRMGAFTINESEFNRNRAEVYDLFPRLDERRSQRAGTLSGGEIKMVAMARALITQPKLVLFDEPSAGLMPKYIDDVFQKVQDIRQDQGTPFLIIEQNVRKLLENSDRTYIIRDGSVTSHAPSKEFIDNKDLSNAYLGGTRGNSDTRAD